MIAQLDRQQPLRGAARWVTQTWATAPDAVHAHLDTDSIMHAARRDLPGISHEDLVTSSGR